MVVYTTPSFDLDSCSNPVTIMEDHTVLVRPAQALPPRNSEALITGVIPTDPPCPNLPDVSLPDSSGEISGNSSCRIGSCSDAEEAHNSNEDIDDFSWPCAAASPHCQVRQVEAFLLLPQAVATAMDLAFPVPQMFSRSIHVTAPPFIQPTSLVINLPDGSLASPPSELTHPAPTASPRVSDSKRAEIALLSGIQRLLTASSSVSKPPPSLPKRVPGASFKSASFKSRSDVSSSIGFGSSSSRTYRLSAADCDSCSSVSRSVISSSRSVGGASSVDSYRKTSIGMSTDRFSAVSYGSVAPRPLKAVSSGGATVVIRARTSSASAMSSAVRSMGGSIPEVAEQLYSQRSSFVESQNVPVQRTVIRAAVKPDSKKAWCSSTQSRRAVLTAAPAPSIMQQQLRQRAALPVRSAASTPRSTDSVVQQAAVASPLQRLRLSVSVRHVERAISSISKLLPSSLSSQPLQQVKEQQVQRLSQAPYHAAESVVRQSLQTSNAVLRVSTPAHMQTEHLQQKPQVPASHRASQQKQVWGGRGYAEIHGAGAALCRHACIRTRAWN